MDRQLEIRAKKQFSKFKISLKRAMSNLKNGNLECLDYYETEINGNLVASHWTFNDMSKFVEKQECSFYNN